MTLTKKIRNETHKKSRIQSGGGFMDFLRGFFRKKSKHQEQFQNPPQPMPIPNEIVSLFNSIQKISWKIQPNSSYYQVLNVNPDADDISINKSFRRMSPYIHPDKNKGDPTYNKLFQAISLMRDILVDPILRTKYDNLLKIYPPPPNTNPPKEKEPIIQSNGPSENGEIGLPVSEMQIDRIDSSPKEPTTHIDILPNKSEFSMPVPDSDKYISETETNIEPIELLEEKKIKKPNKLRYKNSKNKNPEYIGKNGKVIEEENQVTQKKEEKIIAVNKGFRSTLTQTKKMVKPIINANPQYICKSILQTGKNMTKKKYYLPSQFPNLTKLKPIVIGK